MTEAIGSELEAMGSESEATDSHGEATDSDGEATDSDGEATDSTATRLKKNNKPVGVTATRTHHGGVSRMRFAPIDDSNFR